MGCSSSRTAPMWVIFHGVQCLRKEVLQCGSPKGHRSCQKTCSRMDSTGHSSCQELGPAWAFHKLHLPSSHLQLVRCGVLHGCNVDICSDMVLMGCRQATCFTIFFIKGCRGTSALALGAPPPPPSLTLVSAGLFLSQFSHSSFSQLPHKGFWPSLNNRGTTNITDGLSFGQRQVCLRAVWN